MAAPDIQLSEGTLDKLNGVAKDAKRPEFNEVAIAGQ